MINKNIHFILITRPTEAYPFLNKHLVTGMPDKYFIKSIGTYKCSQITLMEGKLVWVKYFYPHTTQAFFDLNKLVHYRYPSKCPCLHTPPGFKLLLYCTIYKPCCFFTVAPFQYFMILSLYDHLYLHHI